MIRVLPALLLLISIYSCTPSTSNSTLSPDLAGKLVGTYKTTQIKIPEEGLELEGGPFSASDGQIVITRHETALDQVQFTFSYTIKGGTYSTNKYTETALVGLQETSNRIYFKDLSSVNPGTYLGYWLDQDGVISGSFSTKTFTAKK